MSGRKGNKKDKEISLFIFIDALGWEYIKNIEFLNDLAPERRPLKTILGYSSAAIPSIISGKYPNEHGHWSFFYYSPETSPFKKFWFLKLIPEFISSKAKVRRLLSRIIQRQLGFNGYFQLYNVPFDYLSFFDYTEKKNMFLPGGLNEASSIFDYLTQKNIKYFCSNWLIDEETNLKLLLKEAEKNALEFAFLYLAELDSLMHREGTGSSLVREKICSYESQIKDIYKKLFFRYEQIKLYVFSDHGMTDIRETCHLIREVESLGYLFGEDYVALYDSTMARFWFLSEGARKDIREKLNSLDCGRFLQEEELKRLGIYFKDGKYGEAIYLLDPGTLLLPSFMGKKPLAAMHGYHPEDESSDAMILSNEKLDKDIGSITDIYRLMVTSVS